MPYIKQERRDHLFAWPGYMAETPGELNYIISKLCNDYLYRGTRNYERMNAIIGVLESAKSEFYRRVVAPYENDRCEENGDVYT